MRVKRVVARDIQEAMMKIKSELGDDAVILHTRYFKEGGFLGLFRKKYVEVTAAVDTISNEASKEHNLVSRGCLEKEQTNAENGVGSEFTEMKTMMQEMSSMIENFGQTQFSKTGQNLYNRLKKQGIEDKTAQKVVESTLEEYAKEPFQTADELNKKLFTNLLKPINKAKYVPAVEKFNRPKIRTFIGPTGVGKTTTIAKLAAIDAVIEKKKVAMITVDTYRIAAVEQLKTIGEIMNVPVKVIYTPENLKECLQKMLENDVIYIDTAGRSHKNTLQVNELKSYIDNANSDEIFLTLSSTIKYLDIKDILKTYKDLNISSLIFTKLDETSDYGSIYNVACDDRYSISYFTNGQNIPDDIEVAEPIKLVQMLMKEQ
ncbi:MAG: flagellar biosynthesis protein FlhF [Clostridia bacterium]|nr:flagellar biosynthesis protein FlhF [Clostridia bacterium]MDD4047609.1 flagellar biosynthesis protein FlhF [Clostridia bacterium]